MRITMGKILFLFFIAINTFCFVTIMQDKMAATENTYLLPDQKRHRVSEVKIVTRAAFGGAIGTYIGLKFTRHKTSAQKEYLRTSLLWMVFLNVIQYALLFRVFRKKETSRGFDRFR